MLVFGGIFEVIKELNDICAFSIAQKRWMYLSEDKNSPAKKKTIKERRDSTIDRDTPALEKEETINNSVKKLTRQKSANMTGSRSNFNMRRSKSTGRAGGSRPSL